ncbi:MAG: arginine--tRNA ligase [Patescibacteria group bacterium]|nr:arginine--tRNA ligase [Patescibacteria group bacterium]
MTKESLERKIRNLLRKELKPTEAKEIISKLKFFVNFNKEYGDFSTNLVFLLEKISPEKKDEIILKIESKFRNYFREIRIINNYLNFYFSDFYFLKNFRMMFKDIKNSLSSKMGRNRKVIIDYVSANPTGPLTLGNARGAVIGDTMANILKLNGFRVIKEYYINDRGNQIETLGKTILAHLGYLKWEDNFYQGIYLKEIAEKIKKLINIEKQSYEKIGQIVANFILKNHIKPSLKKFGTLHNLFLKESELYRKNFDERVLKILEKKGLIEKREGATFLLLTKIGEHKDEVLIKSNGEPTYFFSDILHYYYKFFIQKSIIEILIVASDHLDHTRRLKKALTIFGIKNYQFQPIVYQFVHLTKGEEVLKMSKRRGIFITLDELMREIPTGIIRFFFLQKSPEMTIELDLEQIRQQSEKNPYWYAQYAYVRLNSIIKKTRLSKIVKIDPQAIWKEVSNLEIAKELMADIIKFKEILILTAQEKKPNLIIEFLNQFCQKIHSLYEREKILPSPHRVAFVVFLRNFLEFVFNLLEIKPLQKI